MTLSFITTTRTTCRLVKTLDVIFAKACPRLLITTTSGQIQGVAGGSWLPLRISKRKKERKKTMHSRLLPIDFQRKTRSPGMKVCGDCVFTGPLMADHAIASGHERGHLELRLRTAVELDLHGGFYAAQARNRGRSTRSSIPGNACTFFVVYSKQMYVLPETKYDFHSSEVIPVLLVRASLAWSTPRRIAVPTASFCVVFASFRDSRISQMGVLVTKPMTN